jgi:hypothetical protein
VSTPDYSGRHEARPSSDPWSPQTDEYASDRSSGYARDDRFSAYYGDNRRSQYYRDLGDDPTNPYRDLGNDRTSSYYRELADDRDNQDIRDDDFYDDAAYDRPQDRDALYDEPSSRGGTRHLLSAFLCLLLAPIGIAAMTYGTDRYAQLTLGQAGAERDLRGLVALGAGACILLMVAWIGALSPVGPVLSGLIWGLIPAVLFLASPRDIRREVSDLPVVPDSALSGIVTWLGAGVFLMLGALLVGAGLAAIRRPPRI